MNTPDETLRLVIKSAEAKAKAGTKKLLIFGFLAGAYIAFAAAASTMAAMNLLKNPETYGLGRLVAGTVFVGGLAMVIIAGAELFTGNSLMFAALLQRRLKARQLLRNWSLVLAANLVGGAFVAALIALTGLFHQDANLYGALTIKIAAGKTALDFFPALILGLLCNWLVALAVWMSTAGKTVASKLLAIFFPILIFVVMGFEHSVANAYYIPAGLFANLDPTLRETATNLGANLDSLNFLSLLTNLMPVIIGNVLGGSLFVAAAYYLSLKNPKSKPTQNKRLEKLNNTARKQLLLLAESENIKKIGG
jgi:formate/nitrite transporter